MATIDESKHFRFKVEPRRGRDSLFHAVSHRLVHGQGPLMVRSWAGGDLPMGLAEGVDYWAIVPMSRRIDGSAGPNPDQFQLATSAANALAGIFVEITSLGSGFGLIGPRP